MIAWSKSVLEAAFKRPRSFFKNGAGFRSGEQRESGGRSISMVGKWFQGPRGISARDVTRARSASPRARLARSKSLRNSSTTSSDSIRDTNTAKMQRKRALDGRDIWKERRSVGVLWNKKRTEDRRIKGRKRKEESSKKRQMLGRKGLTTSSDAIYDIGMTKTQRKHESE